MPRVSRLDHDLVAITELIPADGKTSWIAPSAIGWLPHNLYLIDRDPRPILVETGLAAFGPGLVSTLKELLKGRALIVYISRIELDCIGNLARLIESFPSTCIVTAHTVYPLDLVHLKLTDRTMVEVKQFQAGQTADSVGFPELRFIEAGINTLGTGWLYDEASKTLFPSDSFTADLMCSKDTPLVRSSDENLPDVEAFRNSIVAKFDWVANADPGTLTRHWLSKVNGLKPDRIAPFFGRVQSGEALVEKVFARFREALSR